MVVVKLCIILLVIAVGVFYVDMDNWTFAPNGVTGVLKGVSAVFFILVLMLFQPPQKNARIHSGIYRVV
jgi:amino acid transporter